MTKDAALAQVASNTSPEWSKAAFETVVYLSQNRKEFNTDAVWVVLERDYAYLDKPHPRALGPIMLAAAKKRIIKHSGRYENSVRESCHRRPIAVWVSLNGSL